MQPLVEDFASLARTASRHWAADVALVRDRSAEAEQLGVEEERGNDGNVGRVRTAAVVGVIDDEGVTSRDATAECVDDGGSTGRKGADVKRQHHVLRHDLAARVHQCAGRILRLPHDGGEAGAEQRILHLLHDAGETGLHHLQIDGIDGAHGNQRSCVTIRFFHSSTRTICPGRTTVVQSSCSRIAGPAKFVPTSIWSRR